MFKVGDKVVRKNPYSNGWAHGTNPVVITSIKPTGKGKWFSVEGDALDDHKWYVYNFDLYVEPAKTWTPKYAVGDKIMPAKTKSWLRPVVVTGIRCQFIYETGAAYLNNVPEDKVQPFIQKPREIVQDGVTYREII